VPKLLDDTKHVALGVKCAVRARECNNAFEPKLNQEKLRRLANRAPAAFLNHQVKPQNHTTK
jgi:hypothetical protein